MDVDADVTRACGTAVAGALGGLTRWITSGRRDARDAALAVLGGAMAGHYLWPLSLWSIGMEERPQTVPMAAYVAGTLGMSMLRAVSAMIETRSGRPSDA